MVGIDWISIFSFSFPDSLCEVETEGSFSIPNSLSLTASDLVSTSETEKEICS